MALSFVPLWFGVHDLALLIVGILVLDVGVQGLQVTNQSIIYRLAPEARSRVNSAYMVCYFAGGALGSALGASIYDSHRWAGVCVLGAAIGLLAMAGAVLPTPAGGASSRPGRRRPPPDPSRAPGWRVDGPAGCQTVPPMRPQSPRACATDDRAPDETTERPCIDDSGPTGG